MNDANEKPYLLFAGNAYDGGAGWASTFKGAFENLADAVNAAPESGGYGDWWEIVDVRELKVVEEGPDRTPTPVRRVYKADWLQDSPEWITAELLVPETDEWWD